MTPPTAAEMAEIRRRAPYAAHSDIRLVLAALDAVTAERDRLESFVAAIRAADKLTSVETANDVRRLLRELDREAT